MSLTTQFIYHPENDAFIVEKLLAMSNFTQNFDIRGISIGKLNRPTEDYWNAMKSVDVIILLIGSTFHKIAPFIYRHENFLLLREDILGIDISSIPNEWGVIKKKGNIWLGDLIANT